MIQQMVQRLNNPQEVQRPQQRVNLIEEAGFDGMDDEEFDELQAALLQQMEAEGEEFVIPNEEDQNLMQGFIQRLMGQHEEEKKAN